MLHTVLPGCKLQIRRFSLRRLLDDSLDPHELDLITSPNLTSVRSWYHVWNSQGGDDFNDLALLEMASGLSPSLEEVQMRFQPPRNDNGAELALIADREAVGEDSLNWLEDSRPRSYAA